MDAINCFNLRLFLFLTIQTPMNDSLLLVCSMRNLFLVQSYVLESPSLFLANCAEIWSASADLKCLSAERKWAVQEVVCDL